MMDFFTASQAAFTAVGMPGYNIRGDVYGDSGPATSPTFAGYGIIEMMDFYVLSTQFNKKLLGG